MTTSLRELLQRGQSIWYDQLSRELLDSGELDRLIREDGLRGLTSNPTIFEKAISAGAEYETQLRELAASGNTTMEIYERLAIDDIKSAADCFRPVWEESKGGDGYVSLEVNPHLAHDTEGTINEAIRLWAAVNRPNLMIKVPATPEGVVAVRELITRGLNVNVTLIFSIEVYESVMEAYIAGIEARKSRGEAVDRIASVASFFISRIDTAVDKILDERIASVDEKLKAEFTALKGTIAIANAKDAYQAFLRVFGTERFKALGARVQRPLWASTGTKNPAYPDVLYINELIGPDTVNTVPPATYAAFLDHGKIDRTIDRDVDAARDRLAALIHHGISIKAVTDMLTADGVKAFSISFDMLIAAVDVRRKAATGSASKAA